MDFPILLVIDGEFTITYRIIKNIENTLKYIDGKKFVVRGENITCEESGFLMTPDIVNYIKKFRHGRHTNDWVDIAERISIQKYVTEMCPANTYQITIIHKN